MSMLSRLCWIGEFNPVRKESNMDQSNGTNSGGSSRFEPAERTISPRERDFFHLWMSKSGVRKYVLGRNKYAASVSRAVEVDAFIDDFTNDQAYLGRPVIRMSQLPHDCLVVSCVVDGRPLTALNRLQVAGVESLDYFTLVRLSPESFVPVDYCGNNQKDISEHSGDYQWVYERLADNLSRDSFRKVVQFRYTFDLDYMQGFSLTIDRQYFEDFIRLGADEVFVDGGGYDGQTTLAFASRAPDYRRIYFFEPNPSMMEVSKQKLAQLPRIQYIQKGLYSRKGVMQFDSSGGPGSRISRSGQDLIDVIALDNVVSEPVTFIKLDVEGAESRAIDGAANQIRYHAPTLAVCVYHDQAHFWQIPRRILDLNDRYKIYVRHYSEGILETVMFFIPLARGSMESYL
jgi:FkbM family methyltransferase